jgi:non-homologous end joining protein Ku
LSLRAKITTVKQPRKAPVIDLMTALKKSLAATAARGTAAKKTARKRKAA